jgi:hypothetical protein
MFMLTDKVRLALREGDQELYQQLHAQRCEVFRQIDEIPPYGGRNDQIIMLMQRRSFDEDRARMEDPVYDVSDKGLDIPPEAVASAVRAEALIAARAPARDAAAPAAAAAVESPIAAESGPGKKGRRVVPEDEPHFIPDPEPPEGWRKDRSGRNIRTGRCSVQGCGKTLDNDKSYWLHKQMCHKPAGGARVGPPLEDSPIALAFAAPRAATTPGPIDGRHPAEPADEITDEPDVLREVPAERTEHALAELPPNELRISEIRAAHVMMQVEGGAALVAAEGPARRAFERRFMKPGVALDRRTQRGDRIEVARYLRAESLRRIAHRSVTLVTDGRKWGKLSYYPYLVWYIDDAGRAQMELLNLFAYKSATAKAIRADFERASLAVLAMKAKIRAGTTDNCRNIVSAVEQFALKLDDGELLKLLQLSCGVHTSNLVFADVEKDCPIFAAFVRWLQEVGWFLRRADAKHELIRGNH